jgi:hypothetical protein
MRKTSEIRISKSSAWLYFWLADGLLVRDYDSWKKETFTHLDIYEKCLRKLKAIGYSVGIDPDYQGTNKTLSPYHRYAFKNGLEIKIEICQTNFRFEFFQNIVQGERAVGDGKYEYKKYSLMPYLMRKQMDHAINTISAVIKREYECTTELVDTPVLSSAAIIKHCTGNHWKSGSPVNLEDIPALVKDYDMNSNSSDRDKKQIISGEIKYYRDRYTGRLIRGRVFHNINNMWWIQIDKFKYSNVACFELFDPKSEDFAIRRKTKDRMPESRKAELTMLNSIPAGTLKKLLRQKQKAA